MRSLRLALFAEGPTDHAFLGPLLPRVVVRACASANEDVEVHDEVLTLTTPDPMQGQPRATRVAEAAFRADRATARRLPAGRTGRTGADDRGMGAV